MSNTTIFGKPVTVEMLNSAIERSGEFEQTLGEIAQELNDALGDYDLSGSKKTALAVIQAARLAVALVEKANPNFPLQKAQPQTALDVLWEHHLLRGTAPSDAAIAAARRNS